MALASFFDKAALAAAQVLQGVSHAAFAAMIERQVITVAFDGTVADDGEARATLDLTVSILARLYPRIALVHLGGAPDTLDRLRSLALSINPQIELLTSAREASFCLVVGTSRVEADAPVLYLGSDRWLASVSRVSPLGSGQSNNPFGAGAAACFGCANVFRALFNEYLPVAELDGEFTLSLLDFQRDQPAPQNPDIGGISLGTVHLVGAGAIGNGALWALSRVRGFTGDLHVVDHEAIDPTNLQRYVLATQVDVGTAKVELAHRALANSGIKVHPHEKRWGAYLAGRKKWDLPVVAAAVDSAEDRVAIQASLPRLALNAWTQALDLGVSRHDFVGSQACLACLYLPTRGRPSDDEVVAQALGLPDALREVRHLLYSGGPVPQDLVERSAAALKVPVEELLPFVGQPLRAFYSRAVCGGVILALQGSQSTAVEVPMPFQSALAGILLAAELVVNAGGLREAPLPTTTRLNLLRPLAPFLSMPVGKRATGGCLCQDADYVAAYNRKYGLV